MGAEQQHPEVTGDGDTRLTLQTFLCQLLQLWLSTDEPGDRVRLTQCQSK
jgi:hypothetical protein